MNRFKHKSWFVGILIFVFITNFAHTNATNTDYRFYFNHKKSSFGFLSDSLIDGQPSRFTTAVPLRKTLQTNNLGETCATAEVICPGDFPISNRIVNTTQPEIWNPTDPARPICFTENNIYWYTFVAGSTSIEFEIAIDNCTQGANAAIVETDNCLVFKQVSSDFNPNGKACIPQIDEATSRVLKGDNLTIGKRYYLMIDNFGDVGSVLCDFFINLKSGTILRTDLTADKVKGDGSVCTNKKNITYSVDRSPFYNTYNWRVKTGDAVIVGGQGTPSVSLDFGVLPIELCLTVSGLCGASAEVCKVVTLSPLPQRSESATICAGESYTFNGKNYTVTGVYPDTVRAQNPTACDTALVLNLSVIEILPQLFKSGDLSCTTSSVSLSSQVSATPNTMNLSYEWRNASNQVVGTTPSVSVTQAGTYTLLVRGEMNGKRCETTRTITVNKTGITPARPSINGLPTACAGQNATYSISNPDNTLSYNWTIENGTLSTPSPSNSVVVVWNQNITSGKICATANNSCGASDSTCITVGINKEPVAPLISGKTRVCPGSTANYAAPNLPNITYEWVVPAGASITSGAGTNSVIVNWGTSTGGKLCVSAVNSCGKSTQTCTDVTIDNALPEKPVVNGPKDVCPNQTVSYTTPADATITGYLWTASRGVVIVGADNTNTVTVRFENTTNPQVCLKVTNACNLENNSCVDVQINTNPPAEVPILGKTSVCEGETTTYGVASTDATTYAWTVPSGATIISGNGSPSVQVRWGNTASGEITLEIKNACNISRTLRLQNIRIDKLEPNNPVISGGGTVCPNTKGTFSIVNDPSFRKITWSLSNDNGNISSRTDSTGLNVTWTKTGNTDVCVEVESACGGKKRVCFPVRITNALDALPISGPSSACLGDTIELSVADDPDVNVFGWSPPTGASIVQNLRNRVKIRFTSGTGGNVRLITSGGCADGTISTKNITLRQPPQSPTSIEGRAGLCAGNDAVYTALGAVGATRYVWTIPANAAAVGETDSARIRIRWNQAGREKIRVKAVGACGMSQELAFDVVTNAIPTPNAGKDTVVCGIIARLAATLSVGTGTWTVLEKPNPNATILFDNPNSPINRLTTSVAGTYTLKFEENSNGCIGSDTVKITYREKPALKLIEETCASDALNYRVKANISGGVAPYLSIGTTVGTISNGEILSNAVSSATEYALVVRDANGCLSDTLRGQKACFCSTFSGTLLRDSVVVCFNTEGVIRTSQPSVLDPNDKEEFILHNGSRSSIGRILARNQTGIFKFSDANLVFDQVYWVQKIAGNRVADTVSLSDRCFSFSNAVPIIFKTGLNAQISGDTTVCANSDATLVFTANQEGRFRIKYGEKNSSTTQDLSSVRNGQKFNVKVSKSTTYQLIEATSEAGCKATVSDSFVVKIREVPAINAGADQTVCVNTAALSAILPPQYQGTWRSLNGANLSAPTNVQTNVSGLKNGKNTFVFSVQDAVCPSSRLNDTVDIFFPLLPQAKDFNLTVTAGDSLKGELVDKAPDNAYTVTQLEQPLIGYLDLFSKGSFSFITREGEQGVTKFRYTVCTETCSTVCDTGMVSIIIKPNPKPVEPVKVDIPNTITPNDDGVNDALLVDNLEEYKENELIIFNRWGDVIYRAKPYLNDWRGTNQKGDDLPEGTYYYVLKLSLNKGEIKKGDITILR